MSETNTINPISPQEMTNHYVKTVKDMILDLTDKPLEDFLDMQANKGLVKSYKNWKEDLFNRNEGVCLNANQIQAIIDAFNSLNNFVEKKEGEALSKDIADADTYVEDPNFDPAGDRENIFREDMLRYIEIAQREAENYEKEKRAAETKSDLPLPTTPPPPYSRFDPNPNRKGGKRKTRRRRKLKKRKTMKKKRLRRKKTMKKRKSRKRRKTKKRRSKRR